MFFEVRKQAVWMIQVVLQPINLTSSFANFFFRTNKRVQKALKYVHFIVTYIRMPLKSSSKHKLIMAGNQRSLHCTYLLWPVSNIMYKKNITTVVLYLLCLCNNRHIYNHSTPQNRSKAHIPQAHPTANWRRIAYTCRTSYLPHVSMETPWKEEVLITNIS